MPEQGTPVTETELLSQLKTRGYTTGFQRSPLQEFVGDLASITGMMVQRGQMKAPALEVTYNFENIEVIRSTEPYPFPIAQISIFQNTGAKSAMGVWGSSIDKLINADLPEDAPPEDIKPQEYLKGHRIRVALTGGHMQWDSKEKKETPRDSWEVMELMDSPAPAKPAAKPAAGSNPSSKTPIQQALDLLNGKTEQQFYQAIFASPVFKAPTHQTVVQEIIGKQFLPPLEEAGTVTKDDKGVYTVH